MPAKLLALHELGDHANYDRYRDAFAAIYGTDIIRDPLGRQLYLPPNSCEHVCLKPRSWEPGFISIAESWQQARAERIGWILEAIRDPDEIRPNHHFPQSGKQAYLLNVIPDVQTPMPAEHFYVTVRQERTADGGSQITFLSAFCVDHQYWREARKGGKALYKRPK